MFTPNIDQADLDETARISIALDPPRFVKRRHAARIVARQLPVWPLPAVDGRAPAILARPGHAVVLAYPRKTPTDMIASYPPGTRNGSIAHFMPEGTPVLAASDGVVTYAGTAAHDASVVLAHAGGWASYYGGLEHLFVTPTSKCPREQRVKAGDALGFVGSPEPNGLKRLYFELWRRAPDGHYQPVEPTRQMQSWTVPPWHDEQLATAETAGANAA